MISYTESDDTHHHFSWDEHCVAEAKDDAPQHANVAGLVSLTKFKHRWAPQMPVLMDLYL